MDAKIRMVLVQACHAILWLSKAKGIQGSPRTDIVEAIDELLNRPESDAVKPECHCEWDLPGHTRDCPLVLAGIVK